MSTLSARVILHVTTTYTGTAVSAMSASSRFSEARMDSTATKLNNSGQISLDSATNNGDTWSD